jgi:UDP-2-acetamido-2-deoxy-ribo-hexuluronate aminotransferase
VPVLVDIDPQTYNIDPKQLKMAVEAMAKNGSSIYPLPQVKSLASLKPRGVISVGIFGLPADYGRIEALAGEHDLFLIEDAAQSFGGGYPGRKSCSLGDIGCTSFFPAKPLGCYGDGGMCFTDDDKLAGVMRSVRGHGQGRHKYDNDRIGINGRMDTLQAAVLHAKFDVFPEELELRQKVADIYTRLISELDFDLVTPVVPQGYRSAWAQYSLLAQDAAHRSRIQDNLKQKGIPTAVYYPKPLHLQKAFSYLNYREGDFPVSENCSKRIFSIPMHPYLTRPDQEKIVQAMTGRAD